MKNAAGPREMLTQLRCNTNPNDVSSTGSNRLPPLYKRSRPVEEVSDDSGTKYVERTLTTGLLIENAPGYPVHNTHANHTNSPSKKEKKVETKLCAWGQKKARGKKYSKKSEIETVTRET